MVTQQYNKRNLQAEEKRKSLAEIKKKKSEKNERSECKFMFVSEHLSLARSLVGVPVGKPLARSPWQFQSVGGGGGGRTSSSALGTPTLTD